MSGRVQGKRFLVTGGARGMGASHARHLAEEGAAVAIGDVLDVAGSQLADELRADGFNVSYTHLDVTDESSWKTAIEHAVRNLGGIDGLVNNAGITGTPGGPEVEDASAWNATVAVNQTGAYLGLRAVIPQLRAAGGGSVVNISSILGFIGDGDYFAYSATKGALRLMSRSAALKYAHEGIRVNSVCPGMVRTPMNDDEVDADSYVLATPMGRMADPIEVSKAVLFLLSDDASYITGSDLVIDGGYLAR
ncbi:SDR family oxidoreductase [Mycolicibacterium sp. P9-64]|uniref:SDR family NAD(P)-dependent oxidoreductase n=1 Tax=Mycolicibacterium sp. P9-64 TaxID=2024612 RepID=UPI0011EF5A3C|nr:SDR family oxidoreductase [Mycolicibacterium sp. P9-64]KAA0084563.1 SDR family oxidoreductase [Mycolicibacterium sp. P9-64]